MPDSRDKYPKEVKAMRPHSPFLFHQVAEGLSGIISHLQYADDTIILVDAIVDNIWTIEVILRGFELVSCLRVSFEKNYLIGVNSNRDFLDLAYEFLHCKKE